MNTKKIISLRDAWKKIGVAVAVNCLFLTSSVISADFSDTFTRADSTSLGTTETGCHTPNTLERSGSGPAMKKQIPISKKKT